MKKTKIICTMGPNADNRETLKALVDHLDLPLHGVSSGVHAGGAAVFGAGLSARAIGWTAADAVGQCDSGSIGLRRVARPELEHLSDTVHETINLSVLLEHDIFLSG